MKRKFELGRPPAMTKLQGPKRVRVVRTRGYVCPRVCGRWPEPCFWAACFWVVVMLLLMPWPFRLSCSGNRKFRALRLETGNFSWASEGVTRKTRLIDGAFLQPPCLSGRTPATSEEMSVHGDAHD